MAIYKYPENLGKEEYVHAMCISIYNRIPSYDTNSSRNVYSGGEAKAFRTNNVITSNKSALAGYTSKTSNSIMLYIPKDLSYETNVSYNNTEIGGITNFASKLARSSTTAIRDMWDNPTSFFGSVTQDVKNAFDNVRNLKEESSGKNLKETVEESTPSALKNAGTAAFSLNSTIPGTSDSLLQPLSAFTKISKNPHMEYIFEKVSNRSFNFSFVFTPKNEQESTSVKEIIKLLKKSALPKINNMSGNSGMFYDYPCVFDIDFVTNDSTNDWLPQISTCILTSVKSSPISDNGFNTFYNGAPTKISLSLSFEELNPLSSEDIDNGF